MKIDLEPGMLPCLVVTNHEGQFSVWPAHQAIPNGWRAEGSAGSRSECLDRIESIWTDMRPLSLQKKLKLL